MSENPLVEKIRAALAGVDDPEIHRPITELGMVDDIAVSDDGFAHIRVLLTVAGCPMRNTIEADVSAALADVDGLTGHTLEMGVMTPEQRAEMTKTLRGGVEQREIPFAQPGNLTKVIAVASGKGGVGKSSVTVNLALALSKLGRSVGILDADIYGHSVPDMLGLGDARPTVVDDMIMPVPYGQVRVISMGMLKQSRDQVIAWRGPMLDRALTQLLADVYWGDLDFLLLDLPPGTGDVALSIGQHLPGSEVLVVTTPQAAAAEVSERAGSMAAMMHQDVLGVVENMSWLETTCAHCGKPNRSELFGSGGGQAVAAALSGRLGKDVPLLAQIPIDPKLRVGGDEGRPVVEAEPELPAAKAIMGLAERLAARPRGLAGKPLSMQVR